MKSSKASAAFLTKFSSFLSKFKQTSTINIAHDQIRKLFSQYKFSEIAIPFASKMDSCDQLSEKEKKQYIKIYISLIDVYGQDVILEYYERIIQSIAKKGAGVAEVVGHLCRSLLKRIYPKENIANYIRHLINVFQRHPEQGKIIKQIVESFQPEIIAPFQSEIVNLIGQKIAHNPKNQIKMQLIEATLAMILALQSKFYEQNTVQLFVCKNFKSQDWNIRKFCVDIAYALLVINKQANRNLHEGVVQLKYDKIKHVRDSVGNYMNLYKQIYGQEKEKQKERPSLNEKLMRSHRDVVQNEALKRTVVSKSPGVPTKFRVIEPDTKNAPKSLQKSIKNTSRNQGFFQNAGNKDIIRLPESKSIIVHQNSVSRQDKERKRQHTSFSQNYILEKDQFETSNMPNQKQQESQVNQVHQVNFEQYLKNRSQEENFFNLSPPEKQSRKQKQRFSVHQRKQQGYNPHKSYKNNEIKAQNEFKRDYVGQQQIFDSRLIEQNMQILSSDGTSLLKKQIDLINSKMEKFTSELLSKLNSLQKRVTCLEQSRAKNQSISQVSLSSLQKDIKQMKCEIADGYLQQSFEQRFNDGGKQKKFIKKEDIPPKKKTLSPPNSKSFEAPIQSNLTEKIKQSLKENNWDQAFSMAIANNNKNSLIQLLKYYEIPQDRLVQDCLFVELRRNLGNWVVLKWLVQYIQQVEVTAEKLKKLQNDLQKSEHKLEGTQNYDSEVRNYSMLKTILSNQIQSKLERYQKQ